MQELLNIPITSAMNHQSLNSVDTQTLDLEVGPVPNDGAHAGIKDIRPFLKYFNDLVATEVYNDVLFVSEKNENVWW